ncbi:MAG: hypothetical protein ABIH83_05000 [Candidatus Micrarchaeota archaeon]
METGILANPCGFLTKKSLADIGQKLEGVLTRVLDIDPDAPVKEEFILELRSMAGMLYERTREA